MQEAHLKTWYLYLTSSQKILIQTAVHYLKIAKQEAKEENFDYSFLIFPVAKVYEGFLKKFLFDLDLISQEVYEGRRFRIGRAINPDVNFKQRDQWWLYDDLVKICGPNIAKQMWQAWLECRNRIFHYFPKKNKILTVKEAEERLDQLTGAMEAASKCLLKTSLPK